MTIRYLILQVLTIAVIMTPSLAHSRSKTRSSSRPQRLSSARLLKLIRSARAPKASLARLARMIDRRLARANALPFVAEATDELHPALSTPWDLPKNEYPRRAVLRFAVKAFRKPAELRLVAPLAALDDKTRAAVAKARDRNIVLMLTAPRRGAELPLKAVERLLDKLGCSAFASGELGSCDPAKGWCYTRRYALPSRGRRREAALMLELSAPTGGGVGGLKVVSKPR